ncbi:rab-GTPase-TBC domain-containing protein [Absidia repens]|uniref:Rab-GTPase-TBC domain-containing protein n=1 Tax=Absidia repens TaxID=90262 RepID=A0A1X2ITZ0_9FUNG|nr:rab-GTPase-TBC domain-containing protein [Absidia repens]
MEKNAIRKSFWRRQGMKAPGSARIAFNYSQETSSQDSGDGSHEVPVVIGARYSYTSLISGQNTPANSSSPPPLLPSQYRSATKSSLTTSSPSTRNGNRYLGSTKESPKSSSSSQNKSLHHKRHTSSSTPHKSFNAFLEDTNDEWDDCMEDEDNRIKLRTATKVKSKPPLPPAPVLVPVPEPAPAPVPTTSSSTVTMSRSAQASATSQQPPLSQSKSATTASEPPYTSLVPELEQKLTISNSTLVDQSPDRQQTTSSSEVDTSHQLDNVSGVIDNVEDVLKDPTFILHQPNVSMVDPLRTKKMKEALCCVNVDLVTLQSVCWNGIPSDYRSIAWQLLLGYLPCNSERRVETLARKRKEYLGSVKASYSGANVGLDQSLWHQIHIDILRTNPTVLLYQSTITQECLERILYQWAIRHPAAGYVQGINDLLTPIFEVFLSTYICGDPEKCDINKLDQDVLNVVEADSFWCLSKLLDGIQDNYTFAQPGIQRQVLTLKDLVSRIDARLANHLQQEGVEFIQFAFRWMNCLLMRELPLKSTIRMWDTYLAEGSTEGFSEFHVYVCAAFLVKWSAKLQKMDFQEIMIFLQQLPTEDWQEKDVELLLSEAYMWKTLFHNAPNHLKNK